MLNFGLILLLSQFVITPIPGWNGDLYWDAASNAASYNIYKGQIGGPYILVNSDPITALTFKDTSWTMGDCYVATAINSSGIESLHSNEVCIEQDPPGQLRFAP